jgi:hypothetical protein
MATGPYKTLGAIAALAGALAAQATYLPSTLSVAATGAIPGAPILTSGDYNGDGRADVALSSVLGAQAHYFITNANGTMRSSAGAPGAAASIAAANPGSFGTPVARSFDADGDGVSQPLFAQLSLAPAAGFGGIVGWNLGIAPFFPFANPLLASSGAFAGSILQNVTDFVELPIAGAPAVVTMTTTGVGAGAATTLNLWAYVGAAVFDGNYALLETFPIPTGGFAGLRLLEGVVDSTGRRGVVVVGVQGGTATGYFAIPYGSPSSPSLLANVGSALGAAFGLPGGALPTSAASGDLDGDGDVDLVMTTPGGLYQFVNNTTAGGSFTFGLVGQLPGSTTSTAAAIFDGDFDGDNDVVAVSGFASATPVWWNVGGALTQVAGALTLGAALPTSNGAAIATGDLDADGDMDVVRVDLTGAPAAPLITVTSLLNQAIPSATPYPGNALGATLAVGIGGAAPTTGPLADIRNVPPLAAMTFSLTSSTANPANSDIVFAYSFESSVFSPILPNFGLPLPYLSAPFVLFSQLRPVVFPFVLQGANTAPVALWGASVLVQGVVADFTTAVPAVGLSNVHELQL